MISSICNRPVVGGLLVSLVVAVAAIAVAQPSSIVVQNWSSIPVGTKGIPPGWEGHKWGSPKYDFTVVQDGDKKVLLLKSDNDSSTITKELKIDAKQYPIIEWRWKVIEIPPRGDARKGETDDEAAQLYVIFPRFPTAVRSRIIGYIWDSTQPVGATFPSDKVGTVRFIVLRSGSADLGKWVTETRNVIDDFKMLYGEEPGEAVGAVTISINSQNTSSRAESAFGEILFKKR